MSIALQLKWYMQTQKVGSHSKASWMQFEIRT